MPEIWDAYDKEFHKIHNVTLVRGEPVPEGMYHLVADIVVKHVDGTYLIMQRDHRKHLGGLWELTAGGSALQGETVLECARRELREETGIEAEEIQEIKRIVHEEYRTLFVEYFCVKDWDKNAITLQEGETIDFRWVNKTELLSMKEEMAAQRTVDLIEKLDL